jgi:alanine racemase
LVGRQGESSYTADDLARAWQSINYEVVCAISSRVPRFYTAQNPKKQPRD